MQYSSVVLVREAAIQLMLWRDGSRTSVEALSQEEEERLHAKGEEEMSKSDWIMEVILLRQHLTRNEPKPSEESPVSKNGLRTRTRR